MTPEEENRIRKWNDGLSHDVALQCIRTEDKRSVELDGFCRVLAKLAPKIRVIKEEGDPNDLPALAVGPRLRYHALPLNRELDPFLAVLSSDPARLPHVDAAVQEVVQQVDIPAFLKLYVTQQCPFCPVTVQQLLPLPATSEHIHLAIIDGTLFPESAKAHGVQSAPTLLLDGQFRWTGSVPLKELAQMMSDRDPAKLGTESLESMLKEGNASHVAAMMLERRMVFPALIDLLLHDKMFVRLGAMVVIETIVEQNAALAAQVIDPLWERFPNVPDPVKGDMMHIFGEAGDKSVISKLNAVLAGQFADDVKEAAREVLEKIKA